MGKQSRRKSGKKGDKKKTHKERQLERAQVRAIGKTLNEIHRRQSTDLQQQQQQQATPTRPFFKGDRVWLYDDRSDGNIPNSYRGIVTRVWTRQDGVDVVDVLPLHLLFRGKDESQAWTMPVRRVFYDWWEWTLRFDVGKRVLCKTFGDDGGWLPASVSYHWPIYELANRRPPCHFSDPMVFYKCKLENDNQLLASVACPEDRDRSIIEYPTSFRFSEGDQVLFSSEKAAGKQIPKKTGELPWIQGTVSRVSVAGLHAYYALYECSYAIGGSGRTQTCHILKDDDEHICKADANPRDRFMDSIEQDCSMEHLNYLVKYFGMDVSTFSDLVLRKAIEFASYNTLLWLQEELNVDLNKIKDEEGNNLLQQIAASRHATRFIEVASGIDLSHEKPSAYIDLEKGVDGGMIHEKNEMSETWLHTLVKEENVRALDVALSPKRGLAWTICAAWNLFTEEDMASLLKAAERTERIDIECIVREFMTFRDVRLKHEAFRYVIMVPSEDNFLKRENLGDFRGPEAIMHARRLIRFSRDWEGHHPNVSGKIANFLAGLVAKGFQNLARLFIDADNSLLNSLCERRTLQANNDEFVQPELKAFDDRDFIDERGLVACAVCGVSNHPSETSYTDEGGKGYFDALRRHVDECSEKHSWLSHMKRDIELIQSKKSPRYATKERLEMFLCKVALLEDDNTLSNRTKVLDYLVTQMHQPAPNPLDVIRLRQCGILRWMVREYFLNLETEANMGQQDLILGAKKLSLLRNGKVPRSLSTGALLSFAAVEYDDLQSLQWLVEDRGVSIESVAIKGWNLVHTSAYFGRVEIILWLRTLPCYPVLVRQLCGRHPQEKAYAAHMAVERGHVFAADLLLSSGCPAIDSAGVSIDAYAIKSSHAFVRKWGEEKVKPIHLERDIDKLLGLLSSKTLSFEIVKKHIISTKCLEIQTWKDCGYSRFDVPGPLGRAYSSIVVECCNCQQRDFVFWLCNHLSLSQDFHRRPVDNIDLIMFWGEDPFIHNMKKTHEKLSAKYLVNFAKSLGDVQLNDWLHRPCAREIKCDDPIVANPVLSHLTRNLDMGELLVELRNKFLKSELLYQLLRIGKVDVEKHLEHGNRPEEVQEVVNTVCDIALSLGRAEERDFEAYFCPWEVMTSDGLINLNSSIHSNYRDAYPLCRLTKWQGLGRGLLDKVHLFLAVEDYHELMRWCLSHARPWDATMELNIVRISSFLGHSRMLDLFLDDGAEFDLRSSTDDRFQAAMLGAAEAGRATELMGYFTVCKPPADPVVTRYCSVPTDYDGREQRVQLLDQSLAVVAVSGCLRRSTSLESTSPEAAIGDESIAVLRSLIEIHAYRTEELLYAAELILLDTYENECWEMFSHFFHLLREVFGLDVWRNAETLIRISERLIAFWGIAHRADREEELLPVLEKWLRTVVDFGLDIQMLKTSRSHREDGKLLGVLQMWKETQLKKWAQFDIVKSAQPLLRIQGAVKAEKLCLEDRDKGGLLLTHVAAAYDRVDVLQWLVEAHGMNLMDRDGEGRTVLQVADASKAPSTTLWIKEQLANATISSFVATNFRRKLALNIMRRRLEHITKLQAWQRGNIVRQSFRCLLLSRLEEAKKFQAFWRDSLVILSKFSQPEAFSWASMREQFDIRRADVGDSTSIAETGIKLEEATLSAMNDEDIHDPQTELSNLDAPGEPSETHQDYIGGSPREVDNYSGLYNMKCHQIQMTNDVVKWLKQADPKYRSFFVRRMRQLASGNRSRILAKRLKGTKRDIFETYLEQKSGFRILWTKEQNADILVWYVAKHKDVSRLARLIDECQSRSARQQMPVSLLPEFQQQESSRATSISSDRTILLDPLGNVPLKLYEINVNEIEELNRKTWKPRLYLTAPESDIVKAEGTVLVLGRSGTGKTVCICNRMDYDRQRLGYLPSFSQLFVARSRRLSKYVADSVGEDPCCTFTTFDKYLQLLESSLPNSDNVRNLFLPSQRVDFARFKREVYQGDKAGELDALVVWTNIRSFLKGSIEAIQSPEKLLSREDYVTVEKLGKRRCRISEEQRELVYNVFQRYQAYMADSNLWDDCDRIVALLVRLEETKDSDPSIYDELRKTKVYVDEVQDYTQTEILLFFYISGPGDLFLAGDPAQSVVEGVEFRFEEIRSVGYFVAGSERRELIPQKPKTVNVNFRSHSGILNTAAALLRCLFDVFPDSAKQLKEDQGLFRGPRPGVFHRVEANRLSMLVKEKLNGVVILTHDDAVPRWKRVLGGYQLIYGIRASKGLEFKRVILLDFFADMPRPLHKPWRNLLLGRGGLDFNTRHPEVEGHLKLLYTAVTRCIEQLFFAETRSSIAGDAFVRWLTTTSVRDSSYSNVDHDSKEALALINNVDDVEKMVMTLDEWVSQGIDNAEMAEVCGDIDLEQSEALLEKAIFCFEQAKNEDFARKARAHRSSIRFRSDLLLKGSPIAKSTSHTEARASQLMEQLLSENLLLEAKELCRSILPYVSTYAMENLELNLVSKLPLDL